MPDRSNLPVAQQSAAISAISRYIYQTVVSIQQHHPEWIAEKYRKTPWSRPDYQSALMGKLTQSLSQAADRDSLLLSIKKYLQILLAPEFINSPHFSKLFAKIPQLTSPPTHAPTPLLQESDSRVQDGSPVTRGIAILLLDAENLQFDGETEKFLQGVCHYPLQIKLAFANWRSLGKKDAEFHERGYQLIHVPPGKDSADLKMATVGASIFVHYPTAKEIFVCSSDRALTHLRNTLQVHGLTVYQVRKQGDSITVLNSQTGQIQKYSLVASPEITPLQQFIVQLKELIKIEQDRTLSQWVKVTRLSSLFKEKYQVSLSQAVANHLPGSKASEIFTNHPSDFAIHKPSDSSQIYVTLFEIGVASKKDSSPNLEENSEVSETAIQEEINSLEDLEQALIAIVEKLTLSAPGTYVFLSYVGSEFQKQYGRSITQIIKQFNLGSKFTKFLKSCSSLKIRKIEKGWQVAIAQTP